MTITRTRRLRIPFGKWGIAATIAIVAVLAVVSYTLVPRITQYQVHIEFPTATGLYAGDDVRIRGVPVGKVASVTPGRDNVAVTIDIDDQRRVPADVKAVILNQSLVSGRFLQLSPAYTGGPTLSDGATIPAQRTVVPVEWDAVQKQLRQISVELGPNNNNPEGAFGDTINSAAANLDGEGTNIHTTLQSLSRALTTISDGRMDLFSTVKNLQVVVSALAASKTQLAQFNTRMASVMTILDDNRTDIGNAITSLSTSLDEIRGFVAANRTQTTTALQQLSDVASTLSARRDDVAQLLHVLPTAASNLTNLYQPAQNAIVSALAVSNFANPAQFVCSAIASAQRTSPERAAKLCAQYLGPLLGLLTMAYPPVSSNPLRGVGALPGQLRYSDPALQPSVPSPTPQRTAPATPRSVPQLLVPGGGG